MSLSCYKDWIGVQGCTTSTPDSGLFINQLPGIELEMIDSLADEQQVDFNGVWDDVQERAVRRFKTDINAEFKKRYLLKNITESIDMGRIIDTASVTAAPPASATRGVTLTLDRQDDNFNYSNLQTIYIPEVSLYFNDVLPVIVGVYDLETGTLLYSKSVAAPLAVGWQTITIEQTFEATRLYIAYNVNNLSSVELDLKKLKNAVNRSQNGCSYYSCGGNRNVEIRGANTVNQTANITESDLTFGDNAFGFSVKWSVVCSFDALACKNKEPFTRAFWYLLAIELMWERMYTSRLNSFTAFDKNKAKELWKMFEITYRGGKLDEIEYEGELPMSIDAINLSLSDYCLECNDEVRIEEMI